MLSRPSVPQDSRSASAALARLDALSHLLDDSIGIPGTRWKLGLDSLLGLVPVAGDALGAALSMYLVNEARKMGAGRTTLLRMMGNLAADFVLGSVPVLGDLLDVAFKANRRNYHLLIRDLHRRGHADHQSRFSDRRAAAR